MLEDANANRRAIASVCYINQRNRRQIHPRFLRRNLRHILDSHEKLLRSPTTHAQPHRDMVANQKRPWGWDFPTTDMLRDYMNGRQPVLQIERLQLRTKRCKTTIRQALRDFNLEALVWPLDPSIRMWRCTVSISISTPRDTQNSKKQIHYESLPATILQFGEDRFAGPNDTHYNISLDKPFFFKVDKLFVVTESGTNGTRSWKRTVNAPYILDISIQFQDSQMSADFFSVLESKDASSYLETPSNETVLRATWEELPNCPVDGQLLTVRRAKGHKSLELDYKLEVAMGWINRKDYVLKTYNKLYDQQQMPARQLPTPSASDDADRPPKTYRILWNFHDGTVTRSMPVKSLTCALCQNRHHYSCFPYLMLHCKRDHDHFTFEVEDITNDEDTAAFQATILMRAAPPQHEKLDTAEDPEMNWIAPDRPFDVKAFIRGEDTWIGQTRQKNRKGLSRLIKERDAQPGPSALPSRKRPALDDVDDLPQHTSKKHRVPNVPGVTFYRTTSKQPISPGTLITESDDEIDESWLAQKQSRALDELGVTGVAKHFTQAFNRHLAREQSDSSVLTREALVRFTRRHLDELKDAQWQRLFEEKLKQLRSVGVIGDDVIAHCEGLIERAQTHASAGAEKDKTNEHVADEEATAQVNGESSKRRDAGNLSTARSKSPDASTKAHPKSQSSGKSALRDSKDRTPVPPPTPAQTPPTQKRCTCGKVAKDQRQSLACADQRCKRQDYHLMCVGLDRRIPGWRCAECVARSP